MCNPSPLGEDSAKYQTKVRCVVVTVEYVYT